MEQERKENIFYNLIKNETSLTEVFCNFMKYENFRNLFIDMINEKIKNKENIIDKSIVKFQDFDTEVALNNQKNGRIDFQLKINTNKIYLFEIKIETFTNLTPKQPKGYLDYLKELELESENLFFILPKGYFQLKEIENHNIIYWEDILEQLRKQELDKANIFINEFCKILDFRWFYFEKIEFTKEELDLIFSDKKDKGYKMIENVNVPVLMNKLFEVVVEITHNKDIQLKYDKQISNCYGYYLSNNKYKISKKLDIWFGIDYELWEKTKSPFSIQILTKSQKDNDNEHIEKFLYKKQINRENFEKFKDKNGNIIFYIPLKDFLKNIDKNITEELKIRIDEVIALLREYK